MLPDLVENGVLRYDPYLPFSKSSDLYGFLTRHNVMGRMLPDDVQRQRRLVSEITDRQGQEGSWGGTVARTALQMEILLELGVHAEDVCLGRGAAWIFEQFHETVEGWKSGGPYAVTAQSMFTTEDRSREFRDALKEMPEEDPKRGCFFSLPLIQTALALRVLVRLGFEGDHRVLRAYESLLDIQCPDWCATGCRRMLEERAKAQRRRRPRSRKT